MQYGTMPHQPHPQGSLGEEGWELISAYDPLEKPIHFTYRAKTAHLNECTICKWKIQYTTEPAGASQHFLKCMWDCCKN